MTQNTPVSEMYSKMDIAAPVCTKKPKELTIHDDTRIDNYYWLNDREDQEVIEEVLSELRKGRVHLVYPKKGERKKS